MSEREKNMGKETKSCGGEFKRFNEQLVCVCDTEREREVAGIIFFM